MRDLSDIDVVIVTYKRDDLLRNCLASILQTCGADLHVIVVDNSPSQETRKIVDAHPNSDYVESHGNVGFAGGNNLALPLCTRQYTLLLNNDTVIHTRESFEMLASFFDSHPSCTAAQGSMFIDHLGLHCGAGSWFTSLGIMCAEGAFVKDSAAAHIAHKCFAVSGAFFMFRRECVDRMCGGILFHDVFHSYYEETDFCHRIWLAGGEVWYVPTPTIYHIVSATFSIIPRPLVLRRYYRNILFSLSTCLNAWNRALIIPRIKALIFGQAIKNRLLGKRELATAGFGALSDYRAASADILAMRQKVQSLRRRSDSEIFSIVRRRMPLRYLLKAAGA